MDWIDPRYSVASEKLPSPRKGKKNTRRGKRGKPLASQIQAALAQPVAVWTEAFDQALSNVEWPAGCTVEGTFLWSCVMQEQAEVLVRAGMSAKKLADIVSEKPTSTDQERAAQLADVVGLMEQSLETLAFQWIDSADAYAHAALGVAALAWHVPDHGRRPDGDWLTQWMQAVADRIAHVTPDADESILCCLVLQCELPLLIGLATSASKRSVLAEASKAMDFLAEHLEASEDNPAPWLAHGATYLRAALACVLRCRVLANALGLRKWYPPQQKALAELLKHAARWSRFDGTHLLGAGRAAPRCKAMWEALVKQTRSPRSMLAAMAASGLIRLEPAAKAGKAKTRNVKLPALTHYSESAANALMQSDWHKRGARIAIDYSDTEICLEALGPKGKPVLVGEWTVQVECDGQAQLQLDEWAELCWYSDEDVDYLELEAKFGQHARVQRQLILFRADRLLLAADALLCDQPGQWSIKSHLPLAAGASLTGDPQTTEGFIVTESGAHCLALPLFLPEWKRQLTTGNLVMEGEDLVVSLTCHGQQRMYAPVLISLCNRHARKPFTWRRLTVGEDLRIVGADEAVAYRVQTGKDQLLLYRTLAPPKRRTALGMHTLADFFAGRFSADDGEVDTLVEVEASAE